MKNKFIHYTCLLLLSTGICRADEVSNHPAPIKDPAFLIQTELARLDNLIKLTEQTLEGEKHVRDAILQYQQAQEYFIKNPKNNDLLFKVVKTAYKALTAIKENHLMQAFDHDFIEELTIMSQPAAKKGIPKP